MSKNDFIEINNARVNNLKGVSLKIPRNKLIVVTGVSGSGKSSLAFDTLYVEGQRRYVESLNSYARQFLGRNTKPDVDSIKGIPPSIAIEQKVNTRNPRSTVGTSTEVYDYLKILFARVGHTFSPISGKEVRHNTVSDIVDFVLSLPEGTKVAILCALPNDKRYPLPERMENLRRQGFSRIECEGAYLRLNEEEIGRIDERKEYNLVVDRLSSSHSDDILTRLSESVGTALNEGKERCIVRVYDTVDTYSDKAFSTLFEADGITFTEPNELMFTFNSPIGACPRCEGFGRVLGLDEDLVIPNKQLSVARMCVACWRGASLDEWRTNFINASQSKGFPAYKAYAELSDEERNLLWHGAPGIKGIDDFFAFVTANQYKIIYRIILARYRGKQTCPDCKGSRLKKEASYVRVGGKTITELCKMPIRDIKEWAYSVLLDSHEKKVAQRVLTEIRQRIDFLNDVGLEYLTLDRMSSTLSGGESQRINLATSLGSSLVGSLYILDEPSIGMHSSDTAKLISVLKKLQHHGNTVVVVEHDEDIIRSSDEIIDIGPEAGRLGGEVVYCGTYDKLLSDSDSLTAKYLTGKLQIDTPLSRRRWNKKIDICHASKNNLKDVSVSIPLNVMTVVTGVSGSGKSTLISQIFYPEIRQVCSDNFTTKAPLENLHLKGDFSAIRQVEFVDQNPIGRSSRSNPVTYLKAYEEIRKLMSKQPYAIQNGYTPAHFSFNAVGGRCETCQGEGHIKIEMQFMADVVIDCDQCHGHRFKDEILEVKYQGKNIYDILEMTVNQAIDFFSIEKGSIQRKIVDRLKPLQDVGIGYIKMGQSSSNLSGGENQRVKLASFLAEINQPPTLFIFDEPTTGLHFHDIKKLLKAFDALISKGHSLVIIEHNMNVIKCADWIIDMGPEGGEKGGTVVCQGIPEDIAECQNSKTGMFLKKFLKSKQK